MEYKELDVNSIVTYLKDVKEVSEKLGDSYKHLPDCY